MILVIIDAHSKFMDAHMVNSATTKLTVSKLKQTFAYMGLPNTIVSDNGSCFTSEEFQHFCRVNGIKHVTSSPYHPSSNGLAERAVQTLKGGLKKSRGDLEDRLYQFLARYRVTPQATIGQAPADLVMKSKPRTRLDLILPSTHQRVLGRQEYDYQRRDTQAGDRQFYVGDPVWAYNFQGVPKWKQGVLEQRLGPLTFLVRLLDGRLWKRHQDHVKACYPDEGGALRQLPPHNVPVPNVHIPAVVTPPENNQDPSPVVAPTPDTDSLNQRETQETTPRVAKESKVTPTVVGGTPIMPPNGVNQPVKVSCSSPPLTQGPRRSGRMVKPPDKLNL